MMADENVEIFDEAVDDDYMVSREWNKVQGEIIKGGYREGLSKGNEEQLQVGFNKGFSDASWIIFQLAQQRGKISAKISLLSADQTSEMSYLQQQLNSIRKQELDLISASKTKSIEELQHIKGNHQL